MRTHELARRVVIATILLIVSAGGWAQDARESQPDASKVLAQMEQALVPTTGQLARVKITIHENEQADELKSWDAMLVRQRYGDGPRSALVMTRPDDARGSVILTGPRADGARGLWVYTPAERRAREFSPLDADRHFLESDFVYDDLALATRQLREPRITGVDRIEGHEAWKIDAAPARDVYYSRIVTWVDQETRLPLRREYFDRAGRLWKVASYDAVTIEGIPTVFAAHLRDVQSRSHSDWRVRAISYVGDGTIKSSMLAPDVLGELATRPFWKAMNKPLAATAGIAQATTG